MNEYVLGNTASEIERLELQQEVWGAVTERFLDRLGIGQGAICLDVGAGPGLLTAAIAKRVGPRGRVVAIEPAERWVEVLGERCARAGFENVEARIARLEDADLGDDRFDLVLARWVLSFVPDPDAAVARLAGWLAPGGVLAVQDYNHEGVSLFPESAGFRAAVRATRAFYAEAGGDTWVAPRLPRAMRAAGLEVVEVVPNVIAGAPGSPAFRWADAFFPAFVDEWVRRGLMASGERDSFLAEWRARREDPDALFFSPIVVDVAGRKSAGAQDRLERASDRH